MAAEVEVTFLNDAVVVEGPPGVEGPAGPAGAWTHDQAFKLAQMALPIVAGKVEFDMAAANTFLISLTSNVTQIAFKNLPDPGVSVRIQVYVQQDATGGRTFGGWPVGVYPTDNVTPDVDPNPRMRTGLTLDTFDGGASVQVNLVGIYGPIT